ncbi:hypothetical protein BO94DRAFT_544640 [Aspergillus sclerotioniger CBS 115572]|uniref:F-box domain-containing protein n=1 Tax=Aspergillus sclerotioniger CBS 115572 TaxID=1450535 RepID=A0A317X4S2_9EURO|nr:hypothetical protein BO94DRAFT_544640 [Aspergillus sclerotioniger CBS 115572]PWY91948.1 hypothetical protein BO94DRAFT_544640 [Aspergillus sclerotioniger CBS 115572]
MPLLTLPTEIVSIICSHLDPSHLCALRLTCRDLYSLSLEAFSDGAFKSISFLVTTDSLQRLQKIAAHEIFRLRVQELWVVPDLFGSLAEPDCGLAKGRILTAAIIEAIVTEHLDTLEAGTLRDVLKICLDGFENLNRFGLRYRHVSHLASKPDICCLGLRKVEEQLDSNRTYPPPQSSDIHLRLVQSHALAFSDFVRAAIACNRGLTGLSTCRHQCRGLAPRAMTLTPAQYESLLPLLKQLKELHLCISAFGLQIDEVAFKYLLEILAVASPSLELLTFSPWNRGYRLNPHYLSGISQRLCFTRLAELHVRELEITPDALKCFIRSAAPTLKILTMRAISLIVEAIPTVAYRDELKRSWGQIIEFFRDELSLQSLHMAFLFHRGRRVEIIDRSGQLAGNPRPNDGTRTFYSADRAQLSFKSWVGQLTPGLRVFTEVR